MLITAVFSSTTNKQNNIMRSLTLTGLFLLGAWASSAQPAERRVSRDEYIDMWKDEAITQMLEHGIPASITLAQGILESANGNSALAKYANNHFGIKCHNWTGPTFVQDDDKRDECFRKYESAKQSFHDHSLFLSGRSRYASLFTLKITDYKGWAHGLKRAGYATNPKYAYLLIDLIEDHNLDQFDREVYLSNAKPKKTEKIDQEIVLHTGHSIKLQTNGIQFVMAKKGDTFYKISKEFDVALNQLYRYNDLNKEAVLHIDDIIYIQPKRNRSKIDTHTVRKGDSMWKIAQIYGVKLKKLYKKNNMNPGDEPSKGDVINLKRKKK